MADGLNHEAADDRRPPRLDVDGTFNLRDVGELPVAGGGSVRSRRLFRGDAIDAATDAGIRALTRLHLHTIVDLREPVESKLRPPTWCGIGSTTTASKVSPTYIRPCLMRPAPNCQR